MPPEKRTVAVKVLLSDSEALALYRQAQAQDRKPADMLRRGWLLSTFGSLGLAERRAQRLRGDSSELTVQDFQESGFAPGQGLGDES